MDIDKRISALHEAITNWLNKDNDYLRVAIDQTVRDGYFSFPDVKHAILSLKENLTRDALEQWVEESGLSDTNNVASNNALCLHAGNLPMVGFQDALAVLLSGARYMGKISRKDPYLIPTFLNEVKKTGCWSSEDVQWVHRLQDIEGLQNDLILFAGSEESLPIVKQEIKRLNLEKLSTKYLIRTAHFSMALLETRKDRYMEDLTEAIFRYGGKGCRSVAIVISPYELDDIKCELTDHIESFWIDNPQHEDPPPALKYRFAFNKAVERSQAWLDQFLLQEGGLELDLDFICYWNKGDLNTLKELAEKYRHQLQSIYVTEEYQDISIPGFEQRIELLSRAQRPRINWKPDGIDTLAWLNDSTG